MKCFNYPFFFLSQRCLLHKKAPPRELTEEEKQQILHSEEFLIFFDRTIRVIERALAEDSDIFFDYSGRELEEKDGLVSCVQLKKNTVISYLLLLNSFMF